MHEYTFALTLLASVRVKAASVKEARELLQDQLDAATMRIVDPRDGETLFEGEASVEGELDLSGIDDE